MKSIQSRLATGLFISLLGIFIVLWMLVSNSIQELAEEYTASRLHHDIETLLSAVSFDQKGSLSLNQERINPIYKRPFSGHYFSIRNQQTSLRSRSLWDQKLLPESATPGLYIHSHQDGPENQPLIIVTSQFNKQGHQFSISVAEDLTPLISNIQHFKNLFAFTAGIALALLLTIQILLLRKGLQPLNEIKSELSALEQGHITMLSNKGPQELTPVTDEINHLLSILHKRLTRSRDALSDLSHAIKKPLSVLHQLTEQQRFTPQQESIKIQIENIQKLTDRILKRARLAGNLSTGARFDLNSDLPILLKTIKAMYPLKQIDISTKISTPITMQIDREDMLELLGNLLDNAYKWANGKILITINETDKLIISIEDDGPGCQLESIEQLAKRGVRLDETTSGYGFGLAITSDIVSDYDGQLQFGHSTLLSGFKVEIKLSIPHV